jgi:hypothetical protein
MRTGCSCAYVACRPAFHDKLIAIREGMSLERVRPVRDKSGHILRGEGARVTGAVWQFAGARQTFELIGIDFSYIAGVLASLREEVCCVALNAQATITVVSEHACTTLTASLYDLPLSTKPYNEISSQSLIYQGVQGSIAHEPSSMVETKVGILSHQSITICAEFSSPS